MSEYTEFIDSIPVHPHATTYPMMNDEDLQALADDIKAHGQREPIIVAYLDEAMLHEPVVIDGRNRFAACKLAGVEPEFKYVMSLNDRELSPQVIVDWIDSKNAHRRHMTREQRRARIEQVMRQDPSLPDYQIAKRVEASPHTVKRVREANPDLQVANEERVNARGQIRPATYKPDPASPKPRRGPLPDTALNAALKVAKAAESWGRIIADDRFKKNRETIRDINLSRLRQARNDLDAAIAALEGEQE